MAIALAVAATLLALGGLYFPWTAPGEEEFRAAMRHFNAGEWTAATQGLRAAIDVAGQERPDIVKIKAGEEEPYLPHYFLGRAYEHTNPILMWRSLYESRRQGVIRQYDAYFQDLERRLRDLSDEAVRRAESALHGARDHAGFLRSVLDNEDYAWLAKDQPDMVSRVRQLLDKLDRAEQEFDQAKAEDDYLAVGDSEAKIRDLRKDLLDLAQEIQNLMDQVFP